MFIVGAALASIVLLSLPPATNKDIDLVTYSEVITDMRAGMAYYPAMTDGLSRTVGPASTIRAYRLPTMFWVWRLPGLFSWTATLAAMLITGLLVGLATNPIVGLVIFLWLAAVGHPVGAEQWAFVEFWALPLTIASILAIKRERYAAACGLALSAALVRELCVLLIVGGAVAALRYHRRVSPWVAAGIAWIAFFAWHVRQLTPFLSSTGSEPPLLRSGGLEAVASMAGPYTFGIGRAVSVVAVWRTRGMPEWWLTIGLIALIPMAGVLTARFHWGILVFPSAVALLGSDKALFPDSRTRQASPS